MEEALYYSELANILYIRATGHITAAPCTELRNRVTERLQHDPRPIGIYIDFSACEYMDSTFMGLLVGVNKRFQKLSGSRIILFNLNKTCHDLLDTLGIIDLVSVSAEAVEFPQDMEKVVEAGSTNPEFLLNAHENLMELSEENKKKFETLGTILKQQIKKNDSGN